MADVIGPDYSVLGWKIATCSSVAGDEAALARCRAGAAQSAISINNGANQLASMTTAVVGGVLSERFGKRAVLVGAFVGILWINL